ncbi:MAG TPA: hypothetical protein VFB02_01495 [Bradyrhizobium sp.]|jgi:hypothetical protein|nr:hypothetical protein [Bradyrhizobium sp.]
MPGVSASSTEKAAIDRVHPGFEPIWPALARGLIVLIALATPIAVTLLAR